MHKVLKPFSCCFDGSGINKEDLQVGDARVFPADMVAGLTHEGYIEPASVPKQKKAAEPGPDATAEAPAAPSAEPEGEPAGTRRRK